MNSEISIHINKIAALLNENNIDAILVGSNANIYYTALCFFRGYTYITKEGLFRFFTIRNNPAFKNPNIVNIRKPEEITSKLEELGLSVPAVLGLEFDSLSYSDITRLEKAFPTSTFVNSSPVLRKARLTKTEWEINEMRYDGVHQTEAYRHFTKVYKEDMTDVEFQIELERILRLEGCLGYSRVSGNLMEINLGSVLNGDNADTPSPYEFAMGGSGVSTAVPGGANGTEMKPGTTVMVDMNGAFNGYQTDLTRVWKIGEISQLAEKAHECSRRILRTLEKEGIPGVPCSALYEKAMEIAHEEGLEEYFMGHNQKVAFIGHGVGIELNEMPVLTPRSKDVLAENMTLAIEPKFVIPGVGAVGVENTYVVRNDGLENITVLNEEIINLIR